MTPMTVPQAVRSGMRRGMRLAADPTIETYRQIRQSRTISTSSTMTQAWENTGDLLRQAMDKQVHPQK